MMDLSKFKHKTQIRVRNYEVDWMGIVHNSVYSLYFEVGRLEYFKNLGIRIDHHTIQNEFRVVLATNNITYKLSAHYDDLIDIYTRISYVKNTSFGMEAVLIQHEAGHLLAENTNVHVWLDPRTNKPIPISDEFRRQIQRFEGENVLIRMND